MLCPYCLNRDAAFSETATHSGRVYYCDRCPADRKPALPIKYVKEYGKYPSVPISLVGLRAHGKSCFLAGLFWGLTKMCRQAWSGFTHISVGETTLDLLEKAIGELETGKVPLPTDKLFFPTPHIYRFDNMPGVGNVQMFFYDNAGEVYSSGSIAEVCEYYSYITQVEAVAWFISIPRLESPLELERLFSHYTDAMLTLETKSKKQSLVIVLTMADELLDQEEFPLSQTMREVLTAVRPPREGYTREFLDELSNETREWLAQRESHNLVHLAEQSFKSVRYCVTSALGQRPVKVFPDDRSAKPELRLNGPPIPRGVLIPLYWLSWLQLPKATVVPPGAGAAKQEYLSLAEAVSKAPAGSTVQLEAGVYDLAETLVIRQPLVLSGKGMNQTRIVSRAEKRAVDVRADCLCKGISFEYEGEAPANVMVAACKKLNLVRCRFTGAKGEGESSPEQLIGAGLAVAGGTSGSVQECEATGNQTYGVLLLGTTNMTLEKNTCTQNQYGMLFGKDAAGTARENVLKENTSAGLVVLANAHPALVKNECKDNNQDGIRFAGKAADTADKNGSARENVCDNNRRYGILVTNEAAPLLEANRCRSNRGAGISYGHNSTVTPGGTASRNECRDTRQGPGILVRGKSSVKLEGNDCSKNKEVGIQIEGAATGTLIENKCENNDGNGIEIKGEARFEVVSNTCQSNLGAGLLFLKDASCTARSNKCLKNADGIIVSDTAKVILEQNECAKNEGSGIIFATAGGSGAARKNLCEDNNGHGIQVRQGAAPEVSENSCDRNHKSGLSYESKSLGTARNNQCRQNHEHGMVVARTSLVTLQNNHAENNAGQQVRDERRRGWLPWLVVFSLILLVGVGIALFVLFGLPGGSPESRRGTAAADALARREASHARVARADRPVHRHR